MKKLIGFLAASVIAGSLAFAGDFRLVTVVPASTNVTATVTNTLGLTANASIKEIAIIASSSSTSQTATVSLVTGVYTNSIPLLTATALSATSTANTSTPTPVCAEIGDSIIVKTTGASNSVPVYVYVSFSNGKTSIPFYP